MCHRDAQGNRTALNGYENSKRAEPPTGTVTCRCVRADQFESEDVMTYCATIRHRCTVAIVYSIGI